VAETHDDRSSPNRPEAEKAPIGRLFRSFRAYENRHSGIAERFVALELGGAQTVGVLSQPLGEASRIGWLVLHSFGMEQIYFQELESLAARSLAASGHTVLRFHSQGYGDSELPSDHTTVRSMWQDAVEAVGTLVDAGNVRTIGLVGARMGGTIAALAAEATEASALVLWDPVVRGREYLGQLRLLARATELARGPRVRDAPPSARRVYRDADVLDVQGFPVSRAVADEISAIDLLKQLPRFDGRALALRVSPGRGNERALRDLASTIVRFGGEVNMESVVSPEARLFGLSPYRVETNKGRIDSQAALRQEIVERTTRWVSALAFPCRDGSPPT
jgi:pimeloyl-ACP methyl ester carboxylesterase